MALYDTRVFRVGTDWWIAQVHGSTGSGWGDAPIISTSERVYFTCATDRDRESVSARIPAGMLNKLSHRSMVAVLQGAEPLGHRFPMSPANVPDSEAAKSQPTFKDDEGLTWIINAVEFPWLTDDGPTNTYAFEGTCLDDSALRGMVGTKDPNVLDTDRVISLIKVRFADLE